MTRTTMQWVGVVGAQRRIRALYAKGHRKRDLAARLGYQQQKGDLNFMRKDAFTMRRDLAEKVDRLYEELRDVPGPAAHQQTWTPNPNWIAPHEWVGLDIDNPQHNPRKVPRRHELEPAQRDPRADDYTEDGHLVACRTYVDPELWFADSRTPEHRAAMNVCLSCPVQRRCAEWALVHNETYGIWGGIAEHDRHNLRKPLVKKLGGRPMASSAELHEALDQFTNPTPHRDAGA